MSETTELTLPETMHIDSPVEDVAEQQEAPKSRHQQKMEEIAEARQRALEAEIAQGVEYDRQAKEIAGAEGEPEPTAAAEPTVPPPPTEPGTAGGLAQPPVSAPAAADQRFAIEIDGQAYNVTAEEYAQLAHYGAVAARQARQNAYQPPQQPVYQQAVQPPPVAPQQQAPGLSDDDVKAAWRRIAYGNEDDGAAALKELMARQPQQPVVDQQQIIAQATHQAMQAMTLQQNLLTIGQEYPEIFGDRKLAQLAALNLHEIREKRAMLGLPAKTDLDLYREACNEVRSVIGPRTFQSAVENPAQATVATQAAPSVVPSQDKVERKRAAPKLTPTVSRAATAEAQPRQPTGSEIVDWIRQKRGQLPGG